MEQDSATDSNLHRRERGQQLVLIAVVQVLAMALWFSMSAVVPALRHQWHISGQEAAWLTAAVQIGFVFGALLSAATNLADIVRPPVLIAGGVFVGSIATLALAFGSGGLASAIPLRFVTGAALAGVYPVGMRLLASWFEQSRGWALGVLVGALTLGSALPQLINGATTLPWRGVLESAAALALVGASIALAWLRAGPFMTASPPFHPGYVVRMFRDRSQRLVNFGYLGHMWELYAMWTWLSTYVAASYAAWRPGSDSRLVVGATTFAAIGISGVVGCLLGGRLADRYGRPIVTIGAMFVSGSCCLLAAAAFGASPVVLVLLLLVWGASIIADSAQFSAALTEVADQRYVGTALTAQTAMGFLLTIVTIQGLPALAGVVGWRAAMPFLAIGPVWGIISMSRLHRGRRSAEVDARASQDLVVAPGSASSQALSRASDA